MPLELHVSTHVHTDGPIPGPHSLLTLASAAYTADGRPITAFAANLRELPGATPHPAAVTDWRHRADEWLSTRRASRPPAAAVAAYVRWVTDLPGPATFVGDPIDHLFVYWYVQRFSGHWPYARTRDSAAARFTSTAYCPLASCHPQLVRAA